MNSTRSPYYELRQTLVGNPIRFLPKRSSRVIEEQAITYFNMVNEDKNLIGIVENDQITGFIVDNYCDFVMLDVGFY